MFGAMVTFAVLGIASGTLLAWLDGVPSATWLEEAALVMLDALLGFALWWGISGFTLMLHTATVESDGVERYGAIPSPLPRSVTQRCIAKATHPGLWLPLGLLVTFWAT
ncbi:hypothetical protein SAMN04487779_103515 [Belnapia rosea]|uniref:Uncharacterized protein n=2 Tax=Belnapia rosea TaxID=938405 RepID=A0A1G7CU47_9PROT|nr:hypothetical protein SAMN04487779_103515 [Belnapia rosea]